MAGVPNHRQMCIGDKGENRGNHESSIWTGKNSHGLGLYIAVSHLK